MRDVQSVAETVIKYPSDDADDAPMRGSDVMGQPIRRVDGLPKVSGAATYTAEYQIEGLTYAALVYSTIAKGVITHIDQDTAACAPGVLAIMTHENAPQMPAPLLFNGPEGGAAGSSLPVMQDNTVSWNGQPIAVVVAETQDQADEAAALIKVTYHQEGAALVFDALKADAQQPTSVLGEPAAVSIGDAEAALKEAVVAVDQVYRTPRYNHTAIEPHATIAYWDDDRLTVYDSTQYLVKFRNTLAAAFALPRANVRVLAPFVGGAFGGKGFMWDHTLLCAAAAKVARRPVRLELSRAGTFFAIGGRAMSEQRVALGAARTGALSALIHTGTTGVVTHYANFPEQFSFPARRLYRSPNIFIEQKIVNLNMVANTAMRAPGESIGTFALESAIDELAHALRIDPIALRLRNEPTKDPTNDKAFSSRRLREAYQLGAERFGWPQQRVEPRSQRDGKWLIGQGVATAYYPHYRSPASARVRLAADGSVTVATSAQEMGMGTATVQIQHAASRLGAPIEQVAFAYGDSDLPPAGGAGGSTQTASIMVAVSAAIEQAHEQLLKLVSKDSPLAGATLRQVVARNGGLFWNDDGEQGETYADILWQAGKQFIEVQVEAPPSIEITKYSMSSYGAQFCEVRVREDSGEVRIARWVGVFDCGRIMNPRTAESQFRGGVIMGIGMALTEEGVFDERYGRIINHSLAEYHVPVHLDIPPIDILYTNIPDKQAPMGVHGVGEIGITGAAAAVANAVFHATGKRIRDLPITLDKLLA